MGPVEMCRLISGKSPYFCVLKLADVQKINDSTNKYETCFLSVLSHKYYRAGQETHYIRTNLDIYKVPLSASLRPAFKSLVANRGSVDLLKGN